MKFRYSPVALAVFAALGSAGLTPVAAQQAQPQAQSLERVTITGSNIRRTDQETVAPVEIITREQIERSGSQTVADVLVRLPQTGSGAFNDTSNSFAPGSTTVSLRSLGQKATLVLLNGRRVSGFGFAQNISDTFVDLSQIPTAAIERIEILLDGASAIYGSDAIAGVVNVILRRDYQGVEVGANVGFYQGQNDYRATITAGYGDIGKQKFNVMGVLDYYKRDGLTMADTDFGEDRDYRDRQGGRNFQSLTADGTWSQGNNRRAQAECRDPINYAEARNRGLLPTNQSNLALGTGINQPGNTWCPRDFASIFQVVPDQERIGFMGRGTYAFSEKVEAYGEVGYTRNETNYIFQEAAPATTRFAPIAGQAGFTAQPFNQIYAPGASGNPFAANATYAGVYQDLGLRTTDVTSDAVRLLAGLKYSFGTWDFDSAAWYSYSEVDQVQTGLLTTGVLKGLNVPDRAQPPTPIVSGGAYNLNRPSTNSQDLRNSMFGSYDRTAKSELKAIDTRATTEIGSLPGGPIGLAVGAEYRDESIEGVPSAIVAGGGILGSGITSVNGSRTALALYGELALPITRQLEAQLALRYDDYSDFGSTTNPKVGLKFRPTPELLLRANWGRGFKAPSLPEITPSSAFFFTTVSDPLQGGQTVNTAGSINSNPALEAEESRSGTVGVVWEPNANFSAGLSYYDIKWTNQVAFPDLQALVDNNDPGVLRDPAGNIFAINGQYFNLGEVQTSGVDIDLRYKASTTYGRFGTSLTATYINKYEVNGQNFAGTNGAWAATNISAIPRWKGLLSFDWEQGPWVAQLTVNYIHSYLRQFGYDFGDASYFSDPPPTNRVPQTGSLDTKSPSYTTFDLFGRYNITAKFSVSASVLNVLDEEPPWDPSFSTTYFYDRQAGYDIRGRTYRIGANYKF
jgi:iron complex outermembrane receptor protein